MKNVQNMQMLQGILAIAAIICLGIGWFQVLSPEVNDILHNKVFYVLIGLSFILSAQTYPNQTYKYISYAAAALCIVGPFLPANLAMLKTVGLLAGVILSFFGRPKLRR